MTPIPRSLAAMAVVAGLALAACGDPDSSDPEAEVTATADATDESAVATPPTTAAPADGSTPELVAGNVFVTGSSTVEPISVRVSELAAELSGGELSVTVEGPGTGDGFQIFCDGGADVTGASRPIKDEEVQTCTDAGVEFVEIKVGIDGLTVATNPNNTAVECLDPAALYALLGPESEGFETWADANAIAAELGSAFTALPDAALVISGPGEESGTYDSFVEFAIKPFAEDRGQDEVTRADYASSANDNLIVQGIEGADSSLGWVGYAYYKAQADRLRAVAVADESGACVLPTDDTVAKGSYPFSRDLFIYVNVANAVDNPAVRSYVDLYLSDAGIASVSDAGYVLEPEADLVAARTTWATAVA